MAEPNLMDWTKSKWYNSPVATIAKILDPTGISSYGDVYNAWTDNKFDYEDILAPIGALPLLGKFSKITKLDKFAKLEDAAKIAKNPSTFKNTISIGGRTLKKDFSRSYKYTGQEVQAAKDYLNNNKVFNGVLLGTRIANAAGDLDNSKQLVQNITEYKNGGKIDWLQNIIDEFITNNQS